MSDQPGLSGDLPSNKAFFSPRVRSLTFVSLTSRKLNLPKLLSNIKRSKTGEAAEEPGKSRDQQCQAAIPAFSM